MPYNKGMKYAWLIVLIIIVGACTVGLYYLNQHKTSSTTSSTSDTGAVLPDTTIHWGVAIRPYGLKGPGAAYKTSQLQTQVSLAKELGVTDVRANAENEMATNDDFVSMAEQNKMAPTIVLEPIDPHYLDTNTYQNAYDYAFKLAKRYVGRVPYYQLANEASGVAIKTGAAGDKTSDYDPTKYLKLRDEMRGLSDGVHAGDASAQRIISANWLGTGVIDKLVADNINFEVIGWNWYSDMGNDLIKTQSDGTTLNIPQYLSKYHKKFWVVELNRRQGTFDNNAKAQSDFLQTFISSTLAHKNVTGYFVYTLTDECGELSQEHGNLGLVSLTKNSDGTCSVKAKKTAFTTVQSLIKANPKP